MAQPGEKEVGEGGRRGARRKKVVDISSVVFTARKPLDSRLRLIFTFAGVSYDPTHSRRRHSCLRGRATARNLRANL